MNRSALWSSSPYAATAAKARGPKIHAQVHILNRGEIAKEAVSAVLSIAGVVIGL
jgi:hypothetical protein